MNCSSGCRTLGFAFLLLLSIPYTALASSSHSWPVPVDRDASVGAEDKYARSPAIETSTETDYAITWPLYYRDLGVGLRIEGTAYFHEVASDASEEMLGITGPGASAYTLVADGISGHHPPDEIMSATIAYSPTQLGSQIAYLEYRITWTDSGVSDIWAVVLDGVATAQMVTVHNARIVSGGMLEPHILRYFGRYTQWHGDLTTGGGVKGANSVTMTAKIGDRTLVRTESMQTLGIWSATEWPDPNPRVFVLPELGVPRFHGNTKIRIEAETFGGDGSRGWDAKTMYVFLPVVFIPGLYNGMGGEGSFPEAYDYFKATSREYITGLNGIGEGYGADADGAGYPTLWTVSYDTSGNFTDGANALDILIQGRVMLQTYADRVNLVSQSKGGLIGRKYMVTSGAQGSRAGTVKTFVQCTTPNTGSLVPFSFIGFEALMGDLSNVYPTYESFRLRSNRPFIRIPNVELNSLNAIALPSTYDNEYVILYGTDRNTPGAYTDFSDELPPLPRGREWRVEYEIGDGVVTARSALGVEHDYNSILPDRTIPAFQSVPIEQIIVDGFHMGYLQRAAPIYAVFQRLVRNWIEPFSNEMSATAGQESGE